MPHLIPGGGGWNCGHTHLGLWEEVALIPHKELELCMCSSHVVDVYPAGLQPHSEAFFFESHYCKVILTQVGEPENQLTVLQ